MTDFDEMELLTRLRDEVPVVETAPDARRAFRASLAGAAGKSRARRPQWLGARASIAPRTVGRVPIMAGATAVAVGVTAGIVALALPSGGHLVACPPGRPGRPAHPPTTAHRRPGAPRRAPARP